MVKKQNLTSGFTSPPDQFRILKMLLFSIKLAKAEVAQPLIVGNPAQFGGGMKDPFHEIVFKLASRFRLAILRSNLSASPLATLREFPHGACADASLLLAKFLQVNRCGHSLYVLGERHGRRHAWLQLQDLTIDITADQFDDQEAGVIVSSDSAWHSSFNGNVHNVADFCLYDRRSVFELTRAYQVITRCLDT